MNRQVLVLSSLALFATLGACRGTPAAPPPPVVSQPTEPTPNGAINPATGTPTPGQNPGQNPGDEMQPTGPRAEVNGQNYAIVAALTPGAAGAPATLAVDLHGANGYHVNELYPIALDLDVRNGSTPKPNLRRADTAEYAQSGARFSVPVTSTGAGTVVRGRMRFAVCSAENCVPETRNFAVTL